ncbi:hypothetical protein [Mesorhizobium sp.]|uniref:hypothetical protein n=1 Tax=Mesorhizobium sp. TaxID=1871066 RepID=UPI000FE697EA|nr:hypothetical protein [Mesorhizobium sp.]RWA97859.1 MAG: hypothetical protein EOQ33_29930 [Mesorhizobium sp.]
MGRFQLKLQRHGNGSVLLAASFIGGLTYALVTVDPARAVTDALPSVNVGLAHTIEELKDTAPKKLQFRLILENVRANSPGVEGARVFLGSPDVSDQTPVSDIHYVDSIAFYPVPAPVGEDVDFILDATHVVRRVLSGASWNASAIPVILVPIGKGELDRGAVTLESATLLARPTDP